MNISDMIIDKVLYKEFASESSKGIPFTFRSKTNVSLNQETKEIFTFIPKISGNLLLRCHFTSNEGATHTGNFSIYVDDVFMSNLTVTSHGSTEMTTNIDISFGAFSTIKVTGSTDETRNLNSAFVSFEGAIMDKPDKYMMEVI